MKLFFSVALVVLVLLSALAWNLAPAPPRDGKIPLVWCSDDNPARREQIALFNKLHPQYQLRLDPSNMDAQKIIVQSIAGVGPDMFDCYSGSMLRLYVKSGIAWDVTDQLRDEGINVTEDLWPPAQQCITYNDRTYGFPNNAGSYGVFYNKELFDKAGIAYPKGQWTIEQFIETAKKLTVRDSRGRAQQYGLMFDNSIWWQLAWQYGGRMYSPDGTRCVVDSPEAVKGVRLLHDLVYKYRVSPSPQEQSSLATLGGWGSGSITLFGQKRIAMIIGGRWNLCLLRNFKDLKIGAVECPVADHRVFLGVARATVINKDSPRRQQALDFLRYMAGREYNELVNDQADAIAAVKKYSYTQKYMHNPKYPLEDYNEVWRDPMRDTRTEEISPFIKPEVASRLFNKQIDLMMNGQKTAQEAMTRAAKDIDKEIQRTLEIEPDLKAQYLRLTQGGKS